MSEGSVRVALVGLGGYGDFYAAELLRGTPGRDAQLVAGIDPAPERCPHIEHLRQAQVPIYAELDSFFREASADLVIVAAPIHLHAPLTNRALYRGAHVLCEKPLTATIQAAAGMARAAREAGHLVAVGYQWSFSGATQALKRDVMAGAFGRPLRLRTAVFWPRTSAYYQRNGWAGRITSRDGLWVLDSPVSNATAHYLHAMLYILGRARESSARPVDIRAELYRANAIENYDIAALRCHTEQGVEILFYTAHTVPEQSGPIMSWEFERALVEYRHDEAARFTARFHSGEVREYGDPNTDPAEKLWQSVAAVRTGRPVACGIAAATPHVLCVNGAQESASAPAPVPGQWLRVTRLSDGSSLTWVEGLQEALERCFDQGALPAEVGATPWAVGGRLVNLEAYECFPSVGTGSATVTG